MNTEYRWGRAKVDVPHWVYAYINDGAPAAERVLYVGFTNNMLGRDRAHRLTWWHPLATRIVLTEHPDRATAREAELGAIHEHRPIANLNNNPHRDASATARAKRNRTAS